MLRGGGADAPKRLALGSQPGAAPVSPGCARQQRGTTGWAGSAGRRCPAAGGGRKHARLARQDHGQWAGPEGIDQRLGKKRDIAGKPCDARGMATCTISGWSLGAPWRQICATAASLEASAARAIDRLGRQADKTATAQRRGPRGNGRGRWPSRIGRLRTGDAQQRGCPQGHACRSGRGRGDVQVPSILRPAPRVLPYRCRCVPGRPAPRPKGRLGRPRRGANHRSPSRFSMTAGAVLARLRQRRPTRCAPAVRTATRRRRSGCSGRCCAGAGDLVDHQTAVLQRKELHAQHADVLQFILL